MVNFHCVTSVCLTIFPVHRHFYVLAIVNKAVVSILVHIFCWTYVLLGIFLGVENCWFMWYMLSFSGYWKIVL